MAKISGIDWGSLAKYREDVIVPMPDGTEYTLPLIKVRDAGMGEAFLRRYDTLRARLYLLMDNLSRKQDACEEIKSVVNEDSVNIDDTLKELDIALVNISEVQKKQQAIVEEIHKLAIEIIDYLMPYIENTPIQEIMDKIPDTAVIELLNYMLYGGQSEDVEEAEKPENPTQQKSPTS